MSSYCGMINVNIMMCCQDTRAWFKTWVKDWGGATHTQKSEILHIWPLKPFFDPGGVIWSSGRLTHKGSRVQNCSGFPTPYSTFWSDPGGGQGTLISKGDLAQSPKALNRSAIFATYDPPTGSYLRKKCFGWCSRGIPRPWLQFGPQFRAHQEVLGCF